MISKVAEEDLQLDDGELEILSHEELHILANFLLLIIILLLCSENKTILILIKALRIDKTQFRNSYHINPTGRYASKWYARER